MVVLDVDDEEVEYTAVEDVSVEDDEGVDDVSVEDEVVVYGPVEETPVLEDVE